MGLLDDLNDEQKIEFQSEVDRRVASALEKNTKKVTQQLTEQLNGEFQKKLEEEIKRTQEQVSMTEEERIKALSDQLKQQKDEFEKAQLSYRAERKLREAGLADEAVSQLTPLIVAGSNPETIDTQLDVFVATQKSAVEIALQKQKEELASAMNAPMQSQTAPALSPEGKVNSVLNDSKIDPRDAQAQAIQILIDESSASAAGV